MSEPIPYPDAFERKLNEIKKLHEAKRSDYTGGQHPLFNYIKSARLAGITPEQGMFARMCEKIIRLSVLLPQGSDPAVSNESIDDTLRDIAIISILMQLYREGGEWGE